MKIYGVCDSGYVRPFVQEIEARKTRHGSFHSVSDMAPFNFKNYVAAELVSFSAEEAESRWRENLLAEASKLEEKARELRQRAQLKNLAVVPQ